MENRSRGVNVLLIEDNRSDADIIEKTLSQKRSSSKFVVAADGEIAIDYLEKIGADDEHRRPDIILLDLDIPKRGGLEVLEEIKSNPLLRSIPVVILTSCNSAEHISKSYRLNANCFITKPAEAERFVEVVKLIDNFWFSIAMLPSVN